MTNARSEARFAFSKFCSQLVIFELEVRFGQIAEFRTVITRRVGVCADKHCVLLA